MKFIVGISFACTQLAAIQTQTGMDVPTQLSALLGRGIKQFRITDEKPPRISVIDVAVAVTAHGANYASEAVRILCRSYPEIKSGVGPKATATVLCIFFAWRAPPSFVDAQHFEWQGARKRDSNVGIQRVYTSICFRSRRRVFPLLTSRQCQRAEGPRSLRDLWQLMTRRRRMSFNHERLCSTVF